MEKEYWWMSFGCTSSNWPDYKEKVSDIHPFKCKQKGWVLLCWKLISVEEYNLWNELNKDK